MKFDDLKNAQTTEIMKWADTVDNILTPDKLLPVNLKDFPRIMETSERLKQICKIKAEEVKEEFTQIEDYTMDSIESQEYVFKLNRGGMPTTKKKFNSLEKRQRELRVRLSDNDKYITLKEDYTKWRLMVSDWSAHINRLRREMRLLESYHLQTGAEEWMDND